MDLLQMVLGGGSGQQVQQLANRFGLDQQQVQAAVAAMVPALSAGVKRNLAQGDGADSLLSALQRGDHQRVVQEPERLLDEETVNDGNAILGHLLGSKEVSRAVADQATASTGLDSGLMKQMLPLVASLVMGSMGQKAAESGVMERASGGAGGSDGLMGMLGDMLDADNDGSVIDDLAGLAGKFFR